MHVLTVWIDVILVVLAVCLLVVVFYPSVVSYIPVVTHPQASKVALVLFILIVSGVILRQGGSVVLFDYFQLRLPTPTLRAEVEESARV